MKNSACALKITAGGLEKGEKWLFRDLNLEIPKGHFLGIRGPSGAGKTSLLEVMAQTSILTEGSFQRPRSSLAWIDQHCSLTPSLSAGENILLGCLHRRSWLQTLFGLSSLNGSEVPGILEQLDFQVPLSIRVGLLSGGERQRISIARALYQNADLLLADEPVSMLPEVLQVRALDLLKNQTSKGSSVVCVLHNEKLLKDYADQILILDQSTWRFI
ncbi:MAG: ATP-binding cassette domain-containing protein [Bacteriovoracia bacterium]